MDINFSHFFHQASKSLWKGRPPIPGDDKEWPEEWKTIYYKTYPRFEKIKLGDKPPSADLFLNIKRRRTRRDFERRYISKRELSLLLKYSCGITDFSSNKYRRRAYPSGGSRYPIEVYPIIFSSESKRGAREALESGLYHYDVKNHQLDVLWSRGFGNEYLDQLFGYPWAKQASMLIVMTAVFGRNQNKYGERGYRHILLEAGHIGQNIYLISEALGLKCCAITATFDEKLEKLIDIDGITESVVYTILIGK